MAVVERHVGRRAHDGEHLRRVDPVEHAPVRLEVGEVVLLLEPRVLDELRRPRAVAREPVRRDRVREDDARRRAQAEVVLQRRELVVVGGRARDPEAARREHQLVRAVREREVEGARGGEAAERGQSSRERPRLPEPSGAAVARADDVVARFRAARAARASGRTRAPSRLDLVPVGLEQSDQRAEEEDVRRVRDVDPDPHRCAAYAPHVGRADYDPRLCGTALSRAPAAACGSVDRRRPRPPACRARPRARAVAREGLGPQRGQALPWRPPLLRQRQPGCPWPRPASIRFSLDRPATVRLEALRTALRQRTVVWQVEQPFPAAGTGSGGSPTRSFRLART